jgi:flagellar M-ring protein FliF
MSVTAESLQLQPRQPMNNGLRPILMLVGVAAAVAIGVAVALWSKESSYSLLVARVSNSQAAQITQALEASGIPYRADMASGSIMVPSEQINQARLKLAGQGLGGNDGGFDSITKDPGFGVSQFMESARYQHALESELAQTIGNLQSVEGARVHLALPRQSAFVRDRRPATASILVQLKAGRRLAEEQVTSIVNLVASSIPELDANQVTVVDQQGHLLSSPRGNDEYAMRDKQFEYARRIEDVYSQRVEQLLTALVGPGRIHAQVVADVETAVTEEAREQFRPESQIVRSEQQSEEQSRGGGGPQGVPGALTNQPPAGGTALPPPSAAPAATGASSQSASQSASQLASQTAAAQGPENSSKQSTRNYEIDRTLAYTKLPPGHLKRVSVAVLVDNARVTDEEGNVKETPLTTEQIANMTRLVKDTVGFDEKRGDSVSVINASFHPVEEPEAGPLQTTPIWERAIVRDAAKILAGLIIVIILVLQVIKPLMKALMAPQRGQSGGNGDAGMQPLQMLPNAGQAAALNYEQQVADARTTVQQDPRRVSQVVKGWVAEDE